MKLLWRRWYVKATVAIVMVVALLAAVWFVALKPTYTADEVMKRMQTYLRGKTYSYSSPSFRSVFLEWQTETGRCFSRVQRLGGLATPHYIPYRKAWRITTVSSSNLAWLFDERTGTVAVSDPQC